MGSGIWAFFAAIVAIVIAFLSGKKTGKDQTAHKVAEARQKIKATETEKELVQDAAKQVQEMTAEKEAVYGFFNDYERELAEAKQTGNTDYAIEAAKKLAERAIEWQKRNNK